MIRASFIYIDHIKRNKIATSFRLQSTERKEVAKIQNCTYQTILCVFSIALKGSTKVLHIYLHFMAFNTCTASATLGTWAIRTCRWPRLSLKVQRRGLFIT